MDKVEILILRNLLYNEEYLRKVIPFIKADYYEDSNQRIVFEEIEKFVHEYNQPATKEVLCIEVEKRQDINDTTFSEITKSAVEAAFNRPSMVNIDRVNAQQARRFLDRVVGYMVSPLLWAKIARGLSAGRVQSVAVRLVVERERAIRAFVPEEYWEIFADLIHQQTQSRFQVTEFQGKAFKPVNADQASVATTALSDAIYQVSERESKPGKTRPPAPFITSTLQQAASQRLGFGVKKTMTLAQRLYEAGLITYMRTDSTYLSNDAIHAARALIESQFDARYIPEKPNFYANRENAQEAHEAIRPAGDTFRPPAEVAQEVPQSEARAYELIWQRVVASQMTDCTGETVTLKLGATAHDGRDVEFAASGTVIAHMGFREVYEESKVQDRDSEDDADERRLPPLVEGDAARAAGPLEFEGHTTSPPSRFTEASLVKRLEELGVGRPSTYASIIGTIQDRGYVWKKGSALVPSFTAFSVVNVMEGHFPNLVDYAFTAKMEDDLDKIATGTEEAEPWLSRFYFGEGEGGEPGLKEKVSTRLPDIDARMVNTIPLGMSDEGKPVVARVGRYGPYVQMGDSDEADDNQTASIPDDLPPDELTLDKAIEYLAIPKEGRIIGMHPEHGLEIYAKAGRFGPYVQVGTHEDWEERGEEKPPSGSLFSTMSVETLTFEEALQLLSLPRTVGAHPETGEVITVQNGRYGPYLKMGTDSRSLETEAQLLTVTLEECLAILAQPKRRRGQAAPKPPLRDMGPDPETGNPMIVKDGRFGPYVTDGEYNASLRKGDTVEELTVERAAELLADRRAKGPAKKKATKKKAAKKKSAKRAKKKKATKKKAVKKAAASSDDE